MFTDHFAFDASENPDFGGVSITSLNVNLLTPPQKHALRPRRRGFATSNSSKPAFLRLNVETEPETEPQFTRQSVAVHVSAARLLPNSQGVQWCSSRHL